MDAPRESIGEEAAQLHGRLNDLVGMMALPTPSTGVEPAQVVGPALDSLLGMLRLAFVCLRSNDPEGGPSIEIVRVAESFQRTTRVREIREAIDSSLGVAPQSWPLRAQLSIGDVALSVACARLGLHGDLGSILAGSHRSDFPAPMERLLLEVAATRATVAVQHARLVSQQDRLAEHRTLQEALRESEREPLRLLDSIPGQIALLETTGNVDVVSRQILEYSGRSLEELRQWGTSDMVHVEDLPHVIQIFTQSIAAGTPYDILLRLRRFDGVYRWFRNSGFPRRDAHGHVTQWCVLVTDIDDQKRAEDAIRARERDLKLIIDTIPALAWSARADGSSEFFSQHYLDYTGLSAKQAGGWGWTAAVHPDDLHGLAAAWQAIMASEAPGETEARLRRHDGDYRWFLFRTNPLHDETGTIVKWYGINTDIEDRKRVEQELRRSEAFLAQAQRLTRTGSLWWDLSTEEITWSDESYRLLAFPKTTKPSVAIILERAHPEDRSLVREMIVRSARDGANMDFEHRLLLPDGSVRHVHVVVQKVAVGSETAQFMGAITDITERKRAEEELRLAQEALNRAGTELAHVARVTTFSALTASIAHEVNQPLSGIITNASTCLRMLDATPADIEGARMTARRTIRDANRASEVITRLRALFSKREFTLEPLDLNEATREVIALSSSELQKNRVVLQADLAADLPIVHGDRIQIQQVILNLLRNASDAMADVHDRPRQLLIRTKREDRDRVRLTVRDAGVGLPPQSSDAMFDAFYTTKSSGMGIGLFVSRSIVEKHQGRLWAEPNDGEPGAMFAFSLPCGPGSSVDVAS